MLGATLRPVHLIIASDGRRLCYLPDDRVALFVDGTDHVAVPEGDPRWVSAADLTPGVDRPASG